MKTARDGKGTKEGEKKAGKRERRGNGVWGICVIGFGGIDAPGDALY